MVNNEQYLYIKLNISYKFQRSVRVPICLKTNKSTINLQMLMIKINNKGIRQET